MNALDDRLRAALHDLDDRAAAHAARPGAAAPPAGRRVRRRLVTALAAVAVAAVLVAAALALRPTPTAAPVTPATHGSATPTVTPSATLPPDRSQTAADARLWGIYPQLATMPLADRTARAEGDPAPVRTPEGIWQLGHPDVTPFESLDDGCVARVSGAPAYAVCGGSYSEIQLLSPDRSRLLRAYAFPQITVQWFTVTPDAVYCGRTGDGGIPQSMVCRSERGGDLTMKGRFYACDGPDCAPWSTRELATWPGIWSQGTEPIDGEFDGVRLAGGDLVVTGAAGHVTVRLDPRSLRERGRTGARAGDGDTDRVASPARCAVASGQSEPEARVAYST